MAAKQQEQSIKKGTLVKFTLGRGKHGSGKVIGLTTNKGKLSGKEYPAAIVAVDAWIAEKREVKNKTMRLSALNPT